MGNEAKCVVRVGGKRAGGRALLETSELIFRSDELKCKIAFGQMKAVKAVDGELRVATADAAYVFELGRDAEKWAQKILHPKTRVEKLGVKTGMRVGVIGVIEGEFESELKKVGTGIERGRIEKTVECIFFGAETKKGLSNVKKIAKSLQGSMALWIVYPKGRKEITENDVLREGRTAGLKDVKVVGFSATHTALKFVVPVEKR